MRDITKLKRALTEQQIKAAYLLIENELELGKAKTLEEIASEVGISRQTLYIWRTDDLNFIEFKEKLADQSMAGQHEQVIANLMKSINQGSVRAMDLYFSVRGKKVSKSEIVQATVSTTRKPDMTDDEIGAELEKLSNIIGK